MLKPQLLPLIAVLGGGGLLAWSGVENLELQSLPTSHLFAKVVALAFIAISYVTCLGILAAVVCRATRRWPGAYAAATASVASAAGILVSPFAVLAFILTARYAIRAVCSVEALSCSKAAQEVHHSLWLGASYPGPEQLLSALALFVAAVTLSVWRGRYASARGAE